MGFFDNPKVDPSSERSEASVLAVRTILSQKNGFISREEHPDFGADLDVELISQGQASGGRFVVQIKSVQKPTMVTKNGQRFISYEFLTSRLGYLCRSAPGYGILVVYDDSSETALYDLVENIYKRICEAKKPPVWYKQESVTIHIPLSNTLDDVSASRLHHLYSLRFSNHDVLVARHGNQYGIPVIAALSRASGLDPNNPQSIAKFLTEYGAILFNQRDFTFIIDLLRETPPRVIDNSSELSFIAAITFAEAGRLIDAEYYLRKTQRFQLPAEKVAMIKLYSAEVEFRYGRSDVRRYLAELSQLLSIAEGVNHLSIRLRIDYLNVLITFGISSKKKQKNIVSGLRRTEDEIRKADIDQAARHLLLLASAGNLYQLAINLQATHITQFRIREKVIGPTTIKERLVAAQEILDLMRSATNTIESVKRDLKNSDAEDAILPYIQYRLAFMFFSFVFNTFMLDGGALTPDSQSEELFRSRYATALDAYNRFVKIGVLDDAYSALATALELKLLHDHSFATSFEGLTEKELLSRINTIGKQLGRLEYTSLVKQYIQETLPKLNNLDERGFRDIDPGKEREFAEYFALSLDLPEERIENIVADIVSNRKFAEAIPDLSIELLQNLLHTDHRSTMYIKPVVYVAICRKCGFKTNSSQDVERVIEEVIAKHGRSCARS